jgi:seryl-tRNA(Sec) selenium transferase
VAPSDGFAGGGTLPTDTIASRAAVLTVPGVEAFARRLRLHHPAVVGRIAGGALWLDMLAVRDDEVSEIASAVAAAQT